MRKVFAYAVRFALRPGRAAEEIASDPVGVWAGLWWALLFLGAYSVTVLIYWLLGHEPLAQGFLTVPADKWYLVQTSTTIPIGLAGYLSYAGLSHLLCRAAGGTGSFEATFASQMYSTIVPCVLFMLVPELFLAPVLIASGHTQMPWPEAVEIARVFVLPFGWIFFISAVTLSRIHGIHWLPSLCFAVISMIPTGGIMAVFIR